MNVLSALRRTCVGKTSDTHAAFGRINAASGESIYLKDEAGVSVDAEAVIVIEEQDFSALIKTATVICSRAKQTFA